MTSTALRALDVLRDTPRQTAVRQRRHDRVDQGMERLEDRRQDATATLEERTQAIVALRPAWTHEVTAGLVERAPRGTRAPCTAPGPQGGQTGSARGPPDRAGETLGGVIRLRRPDLYGARCQRGHAPLEAALGRTQRRQHPAVQQAAVKWTQELPSETACERCEELTGRPLSPHTAPEVTPEVAAEWGGGGGGSHAGGDRRQGRSCGGGSDRAAPPGVGACWRAWTHPPRGGARPPARASAGPGDACPMDGGVAGRHGVSVRPDRGRADRPGAERAPGATSGRAGGGTAAGQNRRRAP